METIENIQWYIQEEPKNAISKKTHKPLSSRIRNKVIINKTGNIKITFPLNDNYLFFVTREIEGPITIEQLLQFIYNFYQQPLKPEYVDRAFEELEDWKEEMMETNEYENESQIRNIDVFTDTVAADLCGFEYDEEKDEYIVNIGPE
jgi:hypothetical protein